MGTFYTSCVTLSYVLCCAKNVYHHCGIGASVSRVITLSDKAMVLVAQYQSCYRCGTLERSSTSGDVIVDCSSTSGAETAPRVEQNLGKSSTV